MSLPTQYQQYIHLSRYARFNDEAGRRETWEETVRRYIDYFSPIIPDSAVTSDLYKAIISLDVMPSMRALMTAGPALDRDNVAGYNCAYVAVDEPRIFDEIMYVLMCGTGVGFSVESRYTSKLPRVPDELHDTDTTIIVSDSKIGWASAYRELVSLLYSGKVPKWDLSRIRVAGSRLKVFGGRASGPEPLGDLFRFTVHTFQKAAGRQLTTLECHDIVCKIADIVVVGGVRRSALISLSDLADDRIRACKSGNWWDSDVQRALANNSAVYETRPEMGIFFKEWVSLYESKSGERGIFNRAASARIAENSGRRDSSHLFGTNPCSEIILRPKQFCNLSEVVCRTGDDLESLRHKVGLATILGTLQSTLTDFRYLSRAWKTNCEDERLLGVSLTGICDSKLLSTNNTKLKETLNELKQHAVETNKQWADILGINPSSAITCVKPSGTVSQLVDSSSGIHPRFSHYYIRTVRADKKDPLAQWMVDQGFPVEDDVTKPEHNYVFSFPIKSPAKSVLVENVSALEQLELWKVYQEAWCEHKPSVTVYVADNEWMEVGSWVYKNFDVLSGVSFLPKTDHIYRQAPYQEIDAGTFQEASKGIPNVEFSDFKETQDQTSGSQELACVGGICEI